MAGIHLGKIANVARSRNARHTLIEDSTAGMFREHCAGKKRKEL